MHNKKKTSKKEAASSSKGFAASILNRATDSFPYAGSVRPGKQSPQRVVIPGDKHIILPDYALDGRPKKGSSSPLLPWVIEVKTPEEIEKMRASGKLAREILDLAGRAVAPGVTTDEIDALVHDSIVAAGAYPSPLNYHGTKEICRECSRFFSRV
jgi:methionyl aminopeptidase